MKNIRCPALLVLLFFLSINLYSNPFSPISAEIAGQGGAFTSVSDGYNALFSNPAGFAGESGSFTLISANPWIYADVDRIYSLSDKFIRSVNGEETFFPEAVLQASTGGFGIGGTVGLGYVGHGLGLGVVLIADSFFYGKDQADITGDITLTGALIAGYTVDLNFGGLNFNFGGNIRPMMMIESVADNAESLLLLDSFTGITGVPGLILGLDAFYSLGFSFDLGLLFSVGPFSGGISVRDTGSTQRYYEDGITFADSLDMISKGKIPGLIADSTHNIPMLITTGIAFQPELGDLEDYFMPVLHLDLNISDIIAGGIENLGNCLSFGAEIELFRFFLIRGGFSNGRITGGGAVKIPGLEIGCSVFSVYKAQHSTAGAAAEIAIRF